MPGRVGARLVGHVVGRNATWLLFHLISPFNQSVDRPLINDESVIPVRGQVARTPPQEGIHYGLAYRDSIFVPRRDGFVFQVIGNDDYYGYGIDTTAPDRVEAEHAIQTIQSLFPPV